MHNINEKLNKILQRLIPCDTTTLVGVSGGPDSMFLLHKLKAFWKENNYNIDRLHIVTCDHQTRQETKDEVAMVNSFAKPHPCTIVTYEGIKKTEKHLRERRHGEFLKLCHRYNAKHLFLGHHLNDRIETTLLHIMRGCGITGIQGMQEAQTHYGDKTIKIVRPLLSITKEQIEQECNLQSIPYSIDPSNNNILTSKRNKLRSLLGNMKEKSNIEKSLLHLYNFLDQQEHTTTQEEHKKLFSITAGERDEEKLYNTYNDFGIFINPRSNTLHTLSQQLKKSGSKISYQGLTIKAYSYGSIIEKEKEKENN